MVLLLFLILIGFGACSPYQHFNELYEKGEYLQAYEVLKEKNNPNDSQYAINEFQVIFHLSMQGNEQFIPALDALSLRENSDIPQEYRNLARSWIRFLSSQSDTDAISILESIPKKRIKNDDFEIIRLNIYGHSLLSLKQYEELIALFKSSPLAKKSSDFLYMYAMSQEGLGNSKEALKIFEQASKLSLNNKLKSLSHYQIGKISEKETQIEKAISAYYKAWEFYPYNADLNFRLGRLLQQQQKYNDLYARYLRAALRLNPNTAEAWYYLNTQ